MSENPVPVVMIHAVTTPYRAYSTRRGNNNCLKYTPLPPDAPLHQCTVVQHLQASSEPGHFSEEGQLLLTNEQHAMEEGHVELVGGRAMLFEKFPCVGK